MATPMYLCYCNVLVLRDSMSISAICSLLTSVVCLEWYRVLLLLWLLFTTPHVYPVRLSCTLL